ncbi:MAG: hypothetical protein HDT28_04495 [Clostridiales bacterium]|nr:hypothetical protein [Clostridiales bacterium]
MAKITWDDVKKHLDTTYKTDRGNGDVVKITFVYPDDNRRSQLVLVDHEQQQNRLVVEVLSRVGDIATSRLPKALELIGKKYFVALEKMGDLYYVRVSLDMNYVPLSALGNIVELVGRTADALEKDYVGGDDN